MNRTGGSLQASGSQLHRIAAVPVAPREGVNVRRGRNRPVQRGTPIKAAIYRRYGPPEAVVQIEDVEKPVPEDNEVLIKVRAASVNPLDCVVKGPPYIVRVMFGLRKPKDVLLGVDVAGYVEAVGRKVIQFKPATRRSAHAAGPSPSMRVLPSRKVVLKPDSVTFEQAASVPVA